MKGTGMRMAMLLLRCSALVTLVTFICTGCLSSAPKSHRHARYRPDYSGIEPWSWKTGSSTIAPSPAGGTNAAPDATSGHADAAFSRILRKGDKLIVAFRDIPMPEDIKYVIDERGSINLPLAGSVQLEGKRTFEAEEVIQKAYIEGGFYRKIKVIVTAQEDEYVVLGEVKKEGKYVLAPGTTLWRAIGAAGGYTDFAKRWAVELKRGEQVTVHDVDKIADGKESDPMIKASDIINVPRRIL